jgi:hypothetical protein
MNTITHILDDEIPECELLKMMEEVNADFENEWKEIETIAKEQNRKIHRSKNPKKVKEKLPIRFADCERSVDYRFCKECHRKFMDSQPLQGKVFTDASFNIEREDLDRP